MCKNTHIFKPTCLICFEEINDTYLYSLLNDTKICFRCRKKFIVLDKQYKIKNYPMTILYDYNDFFKECLYRYKGLGDLALAPIFFTLYHFKEKYKDYLIVCIPSLEKENEIRHFAPIEQLARVFSTHLFLGLYKKQDFKQALSKDRSNMENHFGIKDGYLLTNKKVLILDDVYTSGNTIHACLELVEQYHPSSIELLVLSLSPKSSLMEIKMTKLEQIRVRIMHFIKCLGRYF